MGSDKMVGRGGCDPPYVEQVKTILIVYAYGGTRQLGELSLVESSLMRELIFNESNLEHLLIKLNCSYSVAIDGTVQALRNASMSGGLRRFGIAQLIGTERRELVNLAGVVKEVKLRKEVLTVKIEPVGTFFAWK